MSKTKQVAETKLLAVRYDDDRQTKVTFYKNNYMYEVRVYVLNKAKKWEALKRWCKSDYDSAKEIFDDGIVVIHNY